MTSKGFNTLNFLLVSFVVLFLGYMISRQPLLPIRNETKRSLGYPRDSLLNFTELTGQYGYSSEEHTVLTQDGYLLTVFRITRARNCPGVKKQPPVILMHGLLQSSDSWIDSGPEAGLAYLIADACYDLWVGNCRGNYYARRHIRLDPNQDPQYWEFSVDEIGLYDVPATIDYVLQHTGSEKVNYIGFSQGAGSYFIMCSERRDYCDKAQVLITLAPAARQTHTKSKLYRFYAESIVHTEWILKRTGVQEVLSKGAISQEFLAFFCQLTTWTENLCEIGKDLLDSTDSTHPGSVRNDTIRSLFGHFPAGTSVHNMARYGQSMRSHDFQKFDYGEEKNLRLYGSSVPPKYNLSAVSVPVVAIYGRNDGLVDVRDVKWLLKRLPRVIEAVEVKDPLWNHLDVTYSQYTNEMIFPKIYEYLLKYSDT